MRKRIISVACVLALLFAACSVSYTLGKMFAPANDASIFIETITLPAISGDDDNNVSIEQAQPEKEIEYVYLYWFWAEIIDTEHGFLVSGLDRNDINYRGELVLDFADNVEFNHYGEPIAKEDLKVGDIILVYFSGTTLESDPGIAEDVYLVSLYD